MQRAMGAPWSPQETGAETGQQDTGQGETAVARSKLMHLLRTAGKNAAIGQIPQGTEEQMILQRPVFQGHRLAGAGATPWLKQVHSPLKRDLK